MARVPNAYSWSAPTGGLLPEPSSWSCAIACSVEQLLRPPRRDHLGVHAGPVEAAEQAGMFDLHAAVHHHRESCGARPGGRGLVDDADLHPEALRADGDGFL